MPARKFANIVLAALLTLLGTPAMAMTDSDGDGVADNLDNCLTIINSDQRDSDADGIGNACDADLNDDCVINVVDLGIFRSRFFSTDADADFNGDGIVNALDLGILKLLFFAPPGPTGSQNICTCVPPAIVPQADPNFEFNGQDVFLTGSLAGNGAAVSGLNNFADQDNGLYLTRIYARAAGSFDYRIADQAASIDYCSDTPLAAYAPLDLPSAGCAAPSGSVEITAPGCYEFALRTDGSLLPPSVELTLGERLGRWDVQVDPAGGIVVVPNGVTFGIPPGAVAAPVTLTIGDIACAQVDALFGATTMNSHANRCIGGFIGEPDGFAFDLPVAVSVPAAAVTADETVLWLSSSPGEQGYALVETVLSYDGDLGTVETTLDQMAIFAAAGAINLNTPPARAAGLPACCSQTPTPPGCCCTQFSVTSTAGDAFDSNCDCQLVGFDIEIQFPSCPGAPVFFDSESHSTENCPTDFQATLSTPDLIQWTCETRNIALSLAGTNDSGQVCNMSIPLSWSVDDNSIANVQSNAVGTSATVEGLMGGTTTFRAESNVGAQFSIVAPLTVVDLSGTWSATETGEQTCVINGQANTVQDMESAPVEVTTDCSTIDLEVVLPGLDGTSGPLTATGNLLQPFNFQILATNSSNTLACAVFFLTAGQDVDFGDPLCPSGSVCEPLSCNETVTTDGTVNAAAFASGAGFSSWTFNASWSETLDGMTTMQSAVCTGESTLTYFKQ